MHRAAKRPPEPPPSFEELVEQHSADVWRLCRHLGDRDSAEDLTQETFLRAYRSLPRFRGDASPRTWVFSIARRVCADHVARLRRERAGLQRLILDEDPRAPHHDVANEQALWGLVDSLEPDRRAAFVLTQVFGLSYAETAEICDCPIGTVRSRVARARTDLALALEDPPVEQPRSSAEAH